MDREFLKVDEIVKKVHDREMNIELKRLDDLHQQHQQLVDVKESFNFIDSLSWMAASVDLMSISEEQVNLITVKANNNYRPFPISPARHISYIDDDVEVFSPVQSLSCIPTRDLVITKDDLVSNDEVSRYFSGLNERSRRNILSLLNKFIETSSLKHRARILKLARFSQWPDVGLKIKSKPAKVERWCYEVAFETEDFKHALILEIARYFNLWEDNNSKPLGISAGLLAFFQYIESRIAKIGFIIKAIYRRIIFTNIRDIRYFLRNLFRKVHIMPNDGKEDAVRNSLNFKTWNLLTNQIFFISWITKRLNNCYWWRTPLLS